MSAAPGLERELRTGLRRPPSRSPLLSPSLALVPARRPAPGDAVLGRRPFVALVVSLLAAGLLGLLALNTALAQDAFRLHTLKQEARTLEDREQALQREVEALQAPQQLAARASALGMVEAGPPAFLRRSDGAVLGAEVPAEAPQPTGEDAPVDPDVPALGGDPTPGPEQASAATGADQAAPEDGDR